MPEVAGCGGAAETGGAAVGVRSSGTACLERLDLVLEIVVGTRTRRLELSQLGEKCEAGSVELESVVRGDGRPFQRRSLPGRGLAKAGPKARDLLLALPDGRFELHPPLATTPVRARRSARLPAE